MRPITFLLGIHNHQPVGNFDWVIEDAYQKAYKPFLDVLERHPGVRLAMHHSGILLDWFDRHHPEHLERLGKLVHRGQVEPLTGGYYEPILPSIPDADKVGQIGKMSRWIEERWGQSPTGLWLAERVWEPTLVGPLVDSGVRYLMVDDAHFLAAGATQDQLWNWWLTEDQGATVGIWPISKQLRYLVPFEPPEKSVELLRELAAGGTDRVALLADDGEKFGVWPDTFERVYAGGWLDKFFTLLAANAEWLKMELPGSVTQSRRPTGRIYLPTASYSEMMEWALPTPVQKVYHRFHESLEREQSPEVRFVRGGFWRNFLAKYPESNLMHKRMLDVRRRLLAGNFPTETRAAALDDIWQAQCNCAYWHGVFGGLYLPHLRDGLYRRILSAEAHLDRAAAGGKPFLRIEQLDLDADGEEEIQMANGSLGILLAPARGGAIESIDYYPRLRNLSHGMTRRAEAYHDALKAAGAGTTPDPVVVGAGDDSVRSIHERVEMKEPGLDQQLVFDWYRRLSLLDHLLREDVSFEQFDRADFGEQGDFLTQPYRTDVVRSTGQAQVTLVRDGTVWQSGRRLQLTIDKRVVMDDTSSQLNIEYRLTSNETTTIRLRFGVEFNFTMLAGQAHDRWYEIDGRKPIEEPNLGGRGQHQGVRAVSLHDSWEDFSVRLAWSRAADLWRLPVDTISQSEAGFERVYQSSCLLPHWFVDLTPGDTFQLSVSLSVNSQS